MPDALPPVVIARLGGCVLAGGRGSRMGGQDKGLIEIGGQPLALRALLQIKPQVHHLVISANRNLERYRSFGVPVASDRLGGFMGPLAGMHAAMCELEGCSEAVLFVPCDAPDIAPDLGQRLGAALAGQRAAVVRAGGRMQPVFCAIRVEEHASIALALARGEQRLHAFFDSIDAKVVDFDDRPEFFRNLNQPEDVAAHLRQASLDEP